MYIHWSHMLLFTCSLFLVYNPIVRLVSVLLVSLYPLEHHGYVMLVSGNPFNAVSFGNARTCVCVCVCACVCVCV